MADEPKEQKNTSSTPGTENTDTPTVPGGIIISAQTITLVVIGLLVLYVVCDGMARTTSQRFDHWYPPLCALWIALSLFLGLRRHKARQEKDK